MALKPLRLIISAVDKATAPVRKVERQLDKLRRPIRVVASKFRALDRASGFRNLRRSIGGVGRAMGRLARSSLRVVGVLGTVGAIAGGAAAAALKRYADEGDRLAKLSARTGFGVEALQELEFGAERSGATVEGLGKALEGFSKRLGETKAGTGTMITLLKKSNPELLEQLKLVTSNEEAFGILTDAIKEETDQSKRAALAAAAFGKQGQSTLLNFLQLGKDGVEDLSQELRDLGGIMSAEAAADAEVFKDRLKDLTTSFEGLRNVIGSRLLPVITPLIGRFTRLIVANRELIGTRVERWIKQIPPLWEKVTRVVREVWEGLRPVVNVIGDLREKWGTANLILAAFGGVVALTVGPALLSLVGAIAAVAGALVGPILAGLSLLWAGVVALAPVFWAATTAVWAFTTALLANPVGATIAAVVALGALGVVLFKKWEPFRNLILKIWDTIKSVGSFAVSSIPGPLKRLFGSDTESSAASTVRPAVSALGPPALSSPASRAEVGGLIRVQVDGPARIQSVEADNPNVVLEALSGRSMLPQS